MTPTFKQTPAMVTRAFKGTWLAGALTGMMAAATPVFAQDAPAPVPGAPADGPMAGHAAPHPGLGRAGDWPGFDLKRFDTNGDGKVTLDELTQKRKADVAAIDANGDGKLSEEEMVNAEIARLRPMIEARVKARIAAQDADGDGQLSAAELMVPPVPERLFNRADANHDGTVTMDEVKAEHRKMMKHMRDMAGAERGPMGPDGRKGDHPGWGAKDHPRHQGGPMAPADDAEPAAPAQQ